MSGPLPFTSVILPPTIFVNETFSLGVNFRNNTLDPNAIGFVPFFDLIAPNELILSSNVPLAVWNATPTIPNLPRWEGPMATTTLSGLTTYMPNGTPILVYPGGYPNSTLPSGPFIANSKLYSINVGYSSYGPSQPELEFSYNAIYDYGNQAIPFTIPPSSLSTRGMFMLGTDAIVNTNDFITEPIKTSIINAQQYETIKTHSLIIGDKQPTGPNYPVQYRLTTHIAPGQTFDDLIIRDPLDAALRHVTSFTPVFSGISLTLAAGPITNVGEYKVPGNDTIANHFYEFHYGSITGAAITGTDLIVDYRVYVDYYLLETAISPSNQTGSPYVLNADNPQNSINITNTVNVFDGPDLLADRPSQTTIFVAGPYALSKSFTGPVNTTGQLIPYTLQIFVSDYFTMRDLQIVDNISGGQIFQNTSSTTPPTYTISGGSGSVTFLSSEITEANLFTAGQPPLNIYNQVTYTIPSNATGNNAIYGGYSGPIFETNATMPNYTINPIDPSVTGVTGNRKTVTINYQTILQDNYAPFYPGFNTNPEFKIELLGTINNFASSSGSSVNIFDITSDPDKVASGSVEINFPSVSIVKSIYAYNGLVDGFPLNGFISPGDILAYRTIMSFPFQNITNVMWRDYLPLPLISVNNYSSLIGNTISSSTPVELNTPWRIFWGPNHTAQLNNGTLLNSTFSIELGPNEINLNYGTFSDDPPMIPITLDIIYTVQIGNQPFKDGLFFTNQSILDIGNNVARTDSGLAVSNFTIAQPFIPGIKKSLTTGNTQQQNTFGLFGSNVTPLLPTSFDPTYYDTFTPVVNTSLVANQNLRYAILIKNAGHHPAHRVQIQDILSNFLTYSSARLYKYTNSGITTLVDSSDYTLTTISPNIIFSLNQQTATPEPNRTLRLDELYVLIIDVITAANLPDCGQIINTVKVNEYYNSPSDTNNYVGTISTIDSVTTTNTSTVRSPSVTMSTQYTSAIGNTEAIGFVPGETITGTLTVAYPPGTTDNVTITAVPTGSMSAVTIAPIAPSNITFGSNVTSGSTWTHTTVTNSNSNNINVIYQFTISIPANQSNATYRTNISFTSGENIPRTCNLSTGRNFRVDRPAITINQQCNAVNLVAGQVSFTYNVTNTTDNILYDVAILNTTPAGLEIVDVSIIPNAGITSITNPIWTISTFPANASYVITVTMESINPPISIGTIFTNSVSGSYAFVPNGQTNTIVANISSLTYNLPIKLQSNLSNITYATHNSDIASNPNRGTVGAIGDVIEYRINIGALPNILYNRLELNFGSIAHPIDQLLLLPTSVVILSTAEISGLGTLPITTSTVSGNRIITLTFPFNEPLGYLVEPQPINANQEYTIILPVTIANHLYNQAGILYDPNLTLTVYQDGTTVPVMIMPNSGILNTCANPAPFTSIDSFRVVEPNIQLTKNFISYTSPATLRYSITIANIAYDVATNPWVSSMFQAELLDDKFDVPGLFTTVNWQTIPSGWTATINGLIARAIMNPTNRLTPGSSITFTIDATYNPANLIQAQSFTNTSIVKYKSKLNDNTNARDGSDGPSTDPIILLNNYARLAQATVLLDKPRISKHLISESTITAGKSIRFGYVVTLPEGTNNNVVIDDIFTNSVFSLGYVTFSSFSIVTIAAQSAGLLTNNFNGTGVGLPGDSISAFVPSNNNFRIGFPSIILNVDNVSNNNSFVIFLDLIVTNLSLNIPSEFAVTNTASLSYSQIPVSINGPTIIPGPVLSTDSKTFFIVHPELFIRKTILTDSADQIVGNQISYQIIIGHTEQSSMPAYNLQISDPLNSNLILANLIRVISSCGLNTTSTLFPVNVSTLPIGCILTITYDAILSVSTPENTIVTNTATLQYNNNDGTNPVPASETLTNIASFTLGADSVIITKECDLKRSIIKPGGFVTYLITYRNNGPTQLTNIVLTEPAISIANQQWLNYVQSNNPGWTQTNPIGPFTFADNIPMLPGTIRTVTFRLDINQNSPPGSYEYLNTVNFESDQIESDATAESINMMVNPPQISVKKFLSSDSELKPNGIVKWIIEYSNTGDFPISNVQLTENIQTMPTQWINFVGPNTWINAQPALDYVFTDSNPLLPSHTKTTVFITQISSTLSRGNYTDTNNISISGNYVNNLNQTIQLSDSDSVDIAFSVDMPRPYVEKSINNSNYAPGGFIEWVITYYNLGESPMTNITLTESPLPIWASLPVGSNWSGSPPTYQPALPTINSGQSNTVSYRIDINSNIVPGNYQYDNIITLGSADTNNLPLPNVIGANAISFNYVAPLVTIEKIYQPGQSVLAPGGQIYWIIRVRNIGNAPALGELSEDISAFNWLSYNGIEWTDEGSSIFTYGINLAGNSTIDVPFIVNIANPLATDNYSINNVVVYRSADDTVTLTSNSIVEFRTEPPIPFIEKTYVAGINNLVAGGQISWDIIYTNRGQTNMHNIKLIENIITVPVQWLTFDGPNSTTGWTETSMGSNVFEYIDTSPLTPGLSRTVRFTVDISNTLLPSTYNFTNVVTLESSRRDRDGTLSPLLDVTSSNPISFIVGPGIPSIEKIFDAGNSRLEQGGFVSWIIRCRNIGQTALQNVRLIEPALPSWLTFSGQPGWTGTGPYEFNVGPILPNAIVNVRFEANISNTLSPGSYSYDNIVTLESQDINNNQLQPITASDDIRFIIGDAFVNVSKTTSTVAATLGSTINWFITINNIGPAAMSDVIITEPALPSWLEFASNNPGWSPTTGPGPFTYDTIDTIAIGQIVTIPFNVTVIAPPPTSPFNYINTATINYDTTKNLFVEANIVVTIFRAVPSMYKTVDNTNPQIGDIVTWFINYCNIGNFPSSNIILTETIPEWMEFIGPIGYPMINVLGWQLNGSVYEYTDSQPLGVGQCRSVYFKTKVIDTPIDPLPFVYTNTVNIAMFDTANPGIPANASADSRIMINHDLPELIISKSTCCNKTTYNPGEQITWTISVKNIGGQIASNVVLTESVLPEYLQFIGPSNWVFTDPNYSYDVGNILPGQSIEVEFTVEANSVNTESATYENIIVATADNDIRVEATHTINVNYSFGVSIEKRAIGRLFVCSNIKYEIKVKNTGNTIINGPLTIFDFYPKKYIIKQRDNADWVINNANNYASILILHSDATLNPGAEIITNIVFNSNKLCLGEYTNEVRLYQTDSTDILESEAIATQFTTDFIGKNECGMAVVINPI